MAVPVIKNRTEIPVLNIASDTETEEKKDKEPTDIGKNMQNSAPKTVSWKKFKKEIVNKMQKRSSGKCITGRKFLLKAKQSNKESWHAVTGKGKKLKKKERIVSVFSEGLQSLEKIEVCCQMPHQKKTS